MLFVIKDRDTFINFDILMFVLEIAWEIISDFAAELIEGPDKERVRIRLAFHIASTTESSKCRTV